MGRPTNEQQSLQRRELNRNQLAFTIWAATPEDMRTPRSKAQFAELIGVTTQTLWRWERDPRVQEAIRFVILQRAGDPMHVQQILDMLHAKALKDNDREAAKVWLTATGVMGQFTRPNGVLDALDEDPENGFADFSDEDLERMFAETTAGAQEDKVVQRAAEILAS